MDGGEHQAQAAPQGALAGDDTGLERRGRRHIERRVAAAYGRGYGPSTAEVRMRLAVGGMRQWRVATVALVETTLIVARIVSRFTASSDAEARSPLPRCDPSIHIYIYVYTFTYTHICVCREREDIYSLISIVGFACRASRGFKVLKIDLRDRICCTDAMLLEPLPSSRRGPTLSFCCAGVMCSSTYRPYDQVQPFRVYNPSHTLGP